MTESVVFKMNLIWINATICVVNEDEALNKPFNVQDVTTSKSTLFEEYDEISWEFMDENSVACAARRYDFSQQ